MADRVVLVNGLPASGSLASAVEGGVILDSSWLSTRDRPFLEKGLVTMGQPRVIEVWCSVPESLAHEPLVVDTTGEVDVATLARRIAEAVAR